MKKIAVIGANGQAGSKIVDEALNQGYEVTAIVRNKAYQNDKTAIIYKDLMSLEKSDLNAFDVVINAFGTWDDKTRHLHTDGLVHLANLLSDTPTRLIVVGGAGGLYADESRTIRLLDTPDFPEAYKPTATAMSNGLICPLRRNLKPICQEQASTSPQAMCLRSMTKAKVSSVMQIMPLLWLMKSKMSSLFKSDLVYWVFNN